MNGLNPTELNKRELLSLDTPLDRTIHRPPARILARLAAHTALTPNQLTVSTLFPAMLAAIHFSVGRFSSALAGLVYFYLWAVLDHADGELARLRKSTSEFGRRLDDACDAIASSAILFGIFLGLSAGAHRLLYGLIFASVMAAEKMVGVVFVSQKRIAREKAYASNTIQADFLRRQKRSDLLTGRESFYLLIAGTLTALALGEPVRTIMLVVLFVGTLMSALYCALASARLSARLR